LVSATNEVNVVADTNGPTIASVEYPRCPPVRTGRRASSYHQRWEIETAFHEVQVQLLNGGGFRSKKPDMVEQEFWGLPVSHYAIRSFMRGATSDGIEPTRESARRATAMHFLPGCPATCRNTTTLIRSSCNAPLN
jgi:hypothetical protein